MAAINARFGFFLRHFIVVRLTFNRKIVQKFLSTLSFNKSGQNHFKLSKVMFVIQMCANVMHFVEKLIIKLMINLIVSNFSQ